MLKINLKYKPSWKIKKRLDIQELKEVKEPVKPKLINNLISFEIFDWLQKPKIKQPNILTIKILSIFQLKIAPKTAPNEIIKYLFFNTLINIQLEIIK